MDLPPQDLANDEILIRVDGNVNCHRYNAPLGKYLIDGTITQTCPSIISIHPTITLRRLYVCTPLTSAIHVPLIQFPTLSGPCINLLEHLDINDPHFVDLNATCFMMLTKDYSLPGKSEGAGEGSSKVSSLASCDF
jgi:hypothetical protein